MNTVVIMGRLGRDAEVSYTSSQLAVARFSIALDRGKDKDGKDRGTDWPSCVAFGKSAENLAKYFKKGDMIAIQGHLQTGSYEKDGVKHYTTDIIVDRWHFCGGKSTANNPTLSDGSTLPEGFEMVDDDDVPF